VRVEVRCCCNPAQLLGWVELPVTQIQEGDVHAFALFDRSAVPKHEILRLPVAYWWHHMRGFDGADEVKINRESGLALKSNDTPIEKLRRIPGFEEAPK